MSFGGQTVTFLSYAPKSGSDGDPDELGARAMDTTSVDVHGCRHRPIPPSGSGATAAMAEEQPEVGVSVATRWWKTTAPPDPAVLAAKASDAISVDGETFQIISGPQPFTDLSGQVFKVTIISERQEIG